MNNFLPVSLLAIVMLLLTSFSSYGAFPVKIAAPDSAASYGTSPVAARHLLANGRHHKDPGQKSSFSILSFSFSLGSWVLLPLGLVLTFTYSSVAFGLTLIMICFLMQAAALVFGIMALVKHQRLKGLAITGVILSGLALLELLPFTFF